MNESLKKQQEISWSFDTTNKVLRSLRFPNFFAIEETKKGVSVPRRVGKAVVKAVLNVIEDHAGVRSWCTVSNPTMAGEAQHSISQVKRALVVLDQEGLVIRQTVRKGNSTTERRLRPNWSQCFESPYCSLDPEQKAILIEKLKRWVPAPRTKVPEFKRSVPEINTKVPGGIEVGPSGGSAKKSKERVKFKREDDGTNRPIVGLGMTSEQCDVAMELVNEICSDVSIEPTGQWTAEQNWEVVSKLAVMVATAAMPDHWLSDALKSIRRRKKDEAVGLGYFVSIFRTKFARIGSNFGHELQAVHLPSELAYLEVE